MRLCIIAIHCSPSAIRLTLKAARVESFKPFIYILIALVFEKILEYVPGQFVREFESLYDALLFKIR